MAKKKAADRTDVSKEATINQHVSTENGVFAKGDEQKLQDAIDNEEISAEDVTRLTRIGAISGFQKDDAEGVAQAKVQDPTVSASMAGRERRANMIEERKIDEEAVGERPASEGSQA
jgi:hypothetical protein